MTQLNPQDVSAFLASRRTTRDFEATPVAPEIIEQLITDGLTAPSWSNTRPFVVAVATGEVRDRISAEFLKRWDAVKDVRGGGLWPRIRIAFTRYGLPTSNWLISKTYHPDLLPRSQRVGRELFALTGIARGDKAARDASWGRNYEFFGAPVELFVFTHKTLGKFAASDAGLFLENLMLSAHAHGLGTCAQGSVAVWEDVIRSEFDISDQYSLLCGVAVGYPSKATINTFKAHRLDAAEITLQPKN